MRVLGICITSASLAYVSFGYVSCYGGVLRQVRLQVKCVPGL